MADVTVSCDERSGELLCQSSACHGPPQPDPVRVELGATRLDCQAATCWPSPDSG